MGRVARRLVELAPAQKVRLDLAGQLFHEARRTATGDELLHALDTNEVDHVAAPKGRQMPQAAGRR